MPTIDKMEENARVIWNKYALKNIIGGIDGMMIPMTNLRSFPPGHDSGLYYNRKTRPALNTLIFANYNQEFFDMVVNAPGSFHDATINRLSKMKAWLESCFLRVQVLGDSALGLNDTMIKPYPRPKAEQHLTKAIFNIRHCAARVEMTEDTFGVLKERFPVLKDMKYELDQAFRVIEAISVLHNLAIRWNEILPRYLNEDEELGLDPLVR